MAVVLLDSDQVYSRGPEVRRLLRILSRDPRGPAWETRSSAGCVLIGTYDGSRIASQPDEWRFATKVPTFWAMYNETWRQTEDGSGQYSLTKAYLHIYRTQDPWKEDEILALHCDPEEEDDPSNPQAAVYKRCPHLHISAAEDPIPKAHLALAAGHIDQVLETASSLTEALRCGMEMIRHEVLDRYSTG